MYTKLNNNPLITIITVSYNAVLDIEATILSVIEQTYPLIEYIIIDGGSTDGTLEIIKKYENQITHWISEPDNGIYDAMNKGIQLAKGEWINFMNAGDLFYNENTIYNIHFEDMNDNIKVIYGDTIKKKAKRKIKIKAKNINTIHRGIICCHQSVFVSLTNKKDILFDCSYKISSDYNQIYNLYFKYKKEAFKYVPIVVSIFDGEFGLSSKNRLQLYKEQLDIRSKRKNLIWYIDYIRYKTRLIIKHFK